MSVYGSIKLFNYNDKLNSIKTNDVLAPIHIRIKPTNACNHNCWFCAYRVENLDLGEEMKLKDQIPQKKMQEIVNNIIEMKIKAVTFSGGGEPLIYPHIVETVEKLGQNNIKVATLTNGSFLKGRVADVFSKYGTWVRISTDAWDDESIKQFRRIKKNDFTNIKNNIESFIKKDSKCVLGISFIVTHENHKHIYDFASIMKETGVHHIKISGCVISNDGKKNNLYHAKIKDRVFEEINKAKDLNSKDFEIINHYHDMDESFFKNYHSCPFSHFLTVIAADQNIYTCQDKAYTNTGLLGSIKTKSFKDFWHSKENKIALNTINPNQHCNHHCVAHNKNLLINDFLALDHDHIDFV